MTEEELKLVVSMQLNQVTQQLNQLKRDVNKAFQDIGNSRDVDHSTDNMERAFRNLNRTSSEEIRQMYRTIRRYLRDISDDTERTTEDMRYALQNMFRGLNGGNFNLSGLSQALRNAIRNAGLGDVFNNSLTNSLNGRGLTNLVNGLGGIGSIATMLGIRDTINLINTMNSDMSDTSKHIVSLATDSGKIVKAFGTAYTDTEALNASVLNLEKILAILVAEFGKMLELLQRIASIQMSTGLMNYGKYVSSAISQVERLKTLIDGSGEAPEFLDVTPFTNALETYKKALENPGDTQKLNSATNNFKETLSKLVQQMIIAQNTLNNLKNMAGMGVFADIDTGSLQKVSDVLDSTLDSIKKDLANLDLSDAGIQDIINQFGQFENELTNVGGKYSTLMNDLKSGEKWKPELDTTDVDQMFNEINKNYLKILEKIGVDTSKIKPIVPEVDTEKAKKELTTLQQLFTRFGQGARFNEIDLDINYDELTQEAAEAKLAIDQLNAKYNQNVNFSNLNGVIEQLDKIRLASQAAATARQHLNDLDQSGQGTSEEAVMWTNRLITAQENLRKAIMATSQQFGQYRMPDLQMIFNNARGSIDKIKNDIQERLTNAFQNVGNKAGNIIYHLGAYFTIPPERMDQIIAQLRSKFSGFWESVKNQGRRALEAIGNSRIVQAVKPAFNRIVTVARETGQRVGKAFNTIWSSRFGAFINNNLSLITRGFRRVITGAKNLAIKFKDSMKKVRESAKNAGDSVSKSTDKIKNGISGLVAKLGGIYLIVNALKALWNMGTEAIQLEGQLQNLYIQLGVIRNQAGDIEYLGDKFQDWARNTASAYGISAQAAIKYGNTFSMLIGRNLENVDTLNMTVDILKQAALIAARTGRTYDDVVERIRSGLLGSTEAIEDLGVYVRENTLKNLLLDSGFAAEYGKELERQLGMSLSDLSKNYSNLDDNAKNLIRTYGVLYQSIERFGRATEESMNTTAGLLLKFQAELSNTKLAIGEMIKPIITVLLPLLTTALQWIQVIASKLGEVFTNIAELLGYEVTDYHQNVDVDYDYNSNIKDGAKEDEEALKKLDTQLAGIDEITKITRSNESSSVDVDLGGIEEGTDILDELEEQKDKLKLPEWLQRIVDHLKVIKARLQPIIDDLKKIWEWVKKIWDAIGGWDGVLNGVATAVIALMDAFSYLALAVWNALKYVIQLAAKLAEGFVLGAFDIDLSKFGSLEEKLNAIMNALRERMATTMEILNGLFQSILNFWNLLTATVDEKGNQIISTIEIIDGFFKKLAHTVGVVLGSAFSVLWSAFDSVMLMIKTWLDENGAYINEKLRSIFTIGTDVLEQLEKSVLFIRDLLINIFENEDFQKIGSDLLTIFSDAFLNVTELIMKFGNDVITLITQPFIDNKDALMEAINNFLAPISTIVESIKETLRSLWESIQNTYDEYIAPTFEKLTKALSDIFSHILDGWNTYIAPTLQAIADKFAWLMEKIQPALDELMKVIGNVIELIGNIITVLTPLFNFLVDTFFPIISPLIEGIGKVVGDVCGIIVDAINGVLEILNGILDFLNGVFTLDWQRAWEGITGIFEGAWDIIWGILEGVASGIWDAFSGIADTIYGVFEGLINGVKGLLGIHSPSTVFAGMGKDLIRGLWNGISSLKDWIWSKIKGFFSGITGSIADFFGINSPSRLFKWYGEMMMLGLGNGLEKTKSVTSAIDNMMGITYNKIDSASRDIHNKLSKMLNINGNLNLAYAMNGTVTPISHKKVLELAQGGIAMSRTNAVVGEAGKEAVLPLENNTSWMDDLTAKISADVYNSSNNSGDVVIQVGENEFARISKKALLNAEKSGGKKIFTGNVRVR